MSRTADPDRGTDGAAGGGCAEAVVAARPAGRRVGVLAGFREPVVWILLAIAFFTYISGKPVDGVLMVIVAVGLIWDAGRRSRDGAVRDGTGQADSPPGPAAEAEPAGTRPAGGGRAAAPGVAGRRPRGWQGGGPGGGRVAAPGVAGRRRSRRPGRGAEEPSPGAGREGRTDGRRRVLITAALLTGGAIYAGVMGSFTRYSWPVTAGIIGLGTIVVLIGWHGPLRRRRVRERLPVAGTLAWAAVIVFGGLWELSALLLQPSITTDSYAHPTISTLTDPVLATGPGRALVLAAWLAFGWYLVER